MNRLRVSLQFRRTMTAPDSLDRDDREAERTLFRRRPGRACLFISSESVDCPHKKEDREGDEDEIDDRVDEGPEVHRHCPCCLCLSDGFVWRRCLALFQDQKDICKIDVAENQSDGRHDDVRDERIYDRPESCADDDADRHIDNVPSHRKFLEILEHNPLLLRNSESAETPSF